VVVGARSAVFAPLPNLGIIVVDEEHDSSYKQDQAPRYNGRDVAVKRAQLQGVPIILGSATPSLESWHRFDKEAGEKAALGAVAPTAESSTSAATTKTVAPTHHLLRLPNRVRHLELARVELIDMRAEVRAHRPGVHLLSRRLEQLLQHTIEAGHQAILMLNRRGYSNFIYCPSCGHVVHCRFCDKTMTYHRSAGAVARGATAAEGLHTGQLHCHYCLAVSPLPVQCPECGKKLSLFGLGTQRVEEELAKKFPKLRFARVDSDSMRNSRDYEKTLARFADGEIDLLLGTQMIAKGLDYPNVTLVGVISGDTALALPDFRAAERTFQLITQVAGRAGRGDAPGRVVVQTFLPDDPAIRFATRQDFPGFARRELASRREVGLPPYTRMARLILRDQDVLALNELGDALKGDLAAAAKQLTGGPDALRIDGPMPCAVARIAGYFRQQIVLYAADSRPIQQILAALREKGSLAKSDRIAVDVDPVSLL
jgi:primosomal protein N' (replication factor Y)